MHPFTSQDIINSGLSGAGGVDQGKYSDCVFEASVAAVATTASGRAAICDAISLNANGSYTVNFPGAPESPITVTQSDFVTLGLTDSATWADVLEAAIIKSDPGFANGANLPPNATGAADGSPPTPAQYALYLLTGYPASKGVASSPGIGVQIAERLADGRPVVAFCANNDEGALVSSHEWTVVSCKTQADQITLRNPWGSYGTAGTTKDGVMYNGNAEVTMSLELFGKYFGEVTFGDAQGAITGTVYGDSEEGMSTILATVALAPAGWLPPRPPPEPSATSTKTVGGSYTFSNVPAGKTGISVYSSFYGSADATLTVIDGQTVTQDFVLTRKGTKQ